MPRNGATTAATPPETMSSDRFGVDDEGVVRLIASRCAECGRFAFPARRYCPRCRRPSMSIAHVGHGATLSSYTVCNSAPSGWRAPYLQAYVDLPEGIKVFTLIADEVEPAIESLAVGMEMEPIVEALYPGSTDLTYKFRPSGRRAKADAGA